MNNSNIPATTTTSAPAITTIPKKSVSPVALHVNICYHSANKQYYKKDSKDLWILVNEKGAERFLMKDGLSSHPTVRGTLSEVDRALMIIQDDQNVMFAGKIAGYKCGVYDMYDQRVLVTESPALITPQPIAYPVLKEVLQGLFGDEQLPYVYGWLHIALKSCYSEKGQQGQALVLAGPPASGKSLFQRLLTIMFGRYAKPYTFMTHGTTFNSEIIGSEHLMIEDEAATKSSKARQQFYSAIKWFTANQDQYCHAKFQNAVNLRPRWQRLTISLNDEPESLLVIPPVDQGLADKLMLLKVERKNMPMPTNTADEQELFWDALISELPGFIHEMLNWKIDPSLADGRYGITHFHHPELWVAMNSLSYEKQLLEVIDDVIFPEGSKRTTWSGSASKLQNELSEAGSIYRAQVGNLCSWPSACGVYLGRLTQRSSGRVSSRVLHGKTIWTINSPDPNALTPEKMNAIRSMVQQTCAKP